MAHSVEGHLQLQVAEYDELIRKLVPAYPAMRPIQLDLLALSLPAKGGLVLDLGGGTGALAAAIAKRYAEVTIEIWDTDPTMLTAARARCAEFGDRVRYIERSFAGPLPPCDAIVACIALHHVKDLAVKAEIYRHVFGALRSGGIFVNADATVPETPVLKTRAFRLWAESMQPHGISKKEAYAHFASWEHEDFYPPLYTELRLLVEAGFAEPECFWREAGAAVFGALKD
jgi:SAM-dependent methyltransferase